MKNSASFRSLRLFALLLHLDRFAIDLFKILQEIDFLFTHLRKLFLGILTHNGIILRCQKMILRRNLAAVRFLDAVLPYLSWV